MTYDGRMAVGDAAVPGVPGRGRDEMIRLMNERADRIARLNKSAIEIVRHGARVQAVLEGIRDRGVCFRCEGSKEVDTSRADDQPARMEPCPVCSGTGLWP